MGLFGFEKNLKKPRNEDTSGGGGEKVKNKSIIVGPHDKDFIHYAFNRTRDRIEFFTSEYEKTETLPTEYIKFKINEEDMGGFQNGCPFPAMIKRTGGNELTGIVYVTKENNGNARAILENEKAVFLEDTFEAQDDRKVLNMDGSKAA